LRDFIRTYREYIDFGNYALLMGDGPVCAQLGIFNVDDDEEEEKQNEAE